MKQKLTFTPIDLHRWSRGEAFYYFSRMAPTGYSLTAELDITTMRRTLKQAATDGWHVSRFLEDLQTEADAFEKYL